ncbi:apoptosis facilitator Bcl-2-like protein 14 [Calypte anna]|uniref:apoptosis facilitator Bcl-2-like protein 14 n=1 Tax=Calypte anna TaxID=9244 RepID=UPI0011C36B87|nr:apoptosis facilitator Bcl-2-like protein 14 [Calypte anna]
MSLPNDVSMEEIPLEDDERDSIEYKILMAYAQRRLSVSKYGKLLKNETNLKRKVKSDSQRGEEGPSQTCDFVFQGGETQQQSKKEPKRKHLPRSCLPFHWVIPQLQGYPGSTSEEPETNQEENSQHQTSETADVNHIADKLAKLVTSRSQGSSSVSSFRAQSHEDDYSILTDGSEDKEHDENKIIQDIVSLLRQEGDRLEEKIKKDYVLRQHFKEMLSYTFFEKVTDLFLEYVTADSKSKPEDQVQCTKVAFTMEIATRLTAVDNHPMNLVLGFGLKYLREHFKPWIQDQGGWEKVLTSLDQEEVE